MKFKEMFKLYENTEIFTLTSVLLLVIFDPNFRLQMYGLVG